MRVFATSGNQVTRLPPAKPQTCFQVEPAPGVPFSLETVRPSTIRLSIEGGACGAPSVGAVSDGPPTIRDSDGNGMAEYQACFDATDLGRFNSCGPARAKATIPLVLEGELSTGDQIRGKIAHAFVARPGKLAAAISPNPLALGSALEFFTTTEGSASARLFDVHGRLLGSLVEEAALEPGFHRIPLEGSAGIGRRLASGIYFVRVATEHDGTETRAVMVLK